MSVIIESLDVYMCLPDMLMYMLSQANIIILDVLLRL